MISGGDATVVVRDVDVSIRFYTDVLGLRLTNRFGDDWATVGAGDGLTIGIHPASPKSPEPGTRVSIVLGLDIDVPIDRAVAHLVERGAAVQGAVERTEAGNFVELADPDGTHISLWETSPSVSPERERKPSVAHDLVARP